MNISASKSFQGPIRASLEWGGRPSSRRKLWRERLSEIFRPPKRPNRKEPEPDPHEYRFKLLTESRPDLWIYNLFPTASEKEREEIKQECIRQALNISPYTSLQSIAEWIQKIGITIRFRNILEKTPINLRQERRPKKVLPPLQRTSLQNIALPEKPIQPLSPPEKEDQKDSQNPGKSTGEEGGVILLTQLKEPKESIKDEPAADDDIILLTNRIDLQQNREEMDQVLLVSRQMEQLEAKYGDLETFIDKRYEEWNIDTRQLYELIEMRLMLQCLPQGESFIYWLDDEAVKQYTEEFSEKENCSKKQQINDLVEMELAAYLSELFPYLNASQRLKLEKEIEKGARDKDLPNYEVFTGWVRELADYFFEPQPVTAAEQSSHSSIDKVKMVEIGEPGDLFLPEDSGPFDPKIYIEAANKKS